MTQEKIAVLDLPFHRKTRSSDFFIDILRKRYEVDVFYVDKDPRAIMEELGDSAYDTIVCWQTEFAAPYFALRNKRVVCIPMFDAIANAPDWYWSSMRQCRFISFCSKLHHRLRNVGIETIDVKYYKDWQLFSEETSADTLKGFFWQRRPEEGLDFAFAQRLIGQAVDTLHIHNAPDTANPSDWTPTVGIGTVSRFTPSGDEYRQALNLSNVYIAPRFTEGIGHTLIEAMGKGMCVIAHDEPTANEYIVDKQNGFLIDYRNPPKFVNRLSLPRLENEILLTPEIVSKMGANAKRSVEVGVRNWKAAETQILFHVATAPRADLLESDVAFGSRYLQICKYVNLDFNVFLLKLLDLVDSGLLGKEAATIGAFDRLKMHFRSLPGMRLVVKAARRIRALARRKGR